VSLQKIDTKIRADITRRKRLDQWFSLLGLFALIICVLTIVILLVDMCYDGWERLRPEFFSNFPSRHASRAGILSAWVGSALVMLVTFFVSAPLGVATGVWFEEYAPRHWIRHLLEININNLAGIPSIVYGLLALGLFVHTFGLGQSIFTAGLTLSLLVLPVVIVATREAIRSIPTAMREGAYALGASHWQVVWDHVLPYSMPGILTGIILGMSRAIGETAPIITIGALTFIAFLPPAPWTDTWPYMHFEWLNAPFTVMPIQIFNWTSRPEAAFQKNAAAASVVLVTMTLLMNGFSIWLRNRLRKNLKW